KKLLPYPCKSAPIRANPWQKKKDRIPAALPVTSRAARRSALQRHHADFDATVLGAALLGRVVGDRHGLAEAHDLEALAHQALADEVVGDRGGALLGDALVDRIAADVVGVAGYFHDG